MLKGAAVLFVAFAEMLAAADTMSAGWKGIQPEGGEIIGLATSRVDPRRVYAMTYLGVFASDDAGGTWRAGTDEAKAAIDSVVPDPLDADVAYAIGYHQLHRTTDGGRTWQRVARRLPNGQSFATVVATRTTPTTLLATSVRSRVFRSLDRGVTWSSAGVGLPQNQGGEAVLAAAQTRPGLIYAVLSTRGTYVSQDAGKSWQRVGPATPARVDSLLVDPSDEAVVYGAGEYAGMYKSTDRGRSWVRVEMPRGRDDVWFFVLAPGADGTRILSRTESRNGDSVVMESTDGGESWRELLSLDGGFEIESITTAGSSHEGLLIGTHSSGVIRYTEDAGLHESNSGLYGVWPYSIELDRFRPNRILVAGDGGIYETLDGGNTWKRLLRTYYMDLIRQDANNPPVLYASGSSMWRSPDSGRTWQANPGIFEDYEYAGDFASIPGRPGEVLASVYYSEIRNVGGPHRNMSGAGRRPQSTGGGFVGMYKSLDYGRTWEALPSDFYNVVSIFVDPKHPDVIYTDGYDGIMRSTDGGVHFQNVTDWLDPTTHGIDTFSLDAGNPRRLYISTYNRNDFGHRGVYLSTDGGDTWRRFNNGIGSQRVYSIATDPADSGKIYAGTRAGLMRREIGRGIWRPAPQGFHDTVSEILFHPSDPGTLIINSIGSLFRWIPDSKPAP